MKNEENYHPAILVLIPIYREIEQMTYHPSNILFFTNRESEGKRDRELRAYEDYFIFCDN